MERTKLIIGWVLFVLSNVFWVCVYFMPFVHLSVKYKLMLGSTCAIVGELFFWLSLLLLGKPIIQKIKAWLSPSHWFVKRK